MPERGASFVLAQNLCTVRTAVSTGDSFSTETGCGLGVAGIANRRISERTFVVSMMSVQVFNFLANAREAKVDVGAMNWTAFAVLVAMRT